MESPVPGGDDEKGGGCFERRFEIGRERKRRNKGDLHHCRSQEASALGGAGDCTAWKAQAPCFDHTHRLTLHRFETPTRSPLGPWSRKQDPPAEGRCRACTLLKAGLWRNTGECCCTTAAAAAVAPPVRSACAGVGIDTGAAVVDVRTFDAGRVRFRLPTPSPLAFLCQKKQS